jgi:predicted GTPase
MKRDGPKAPTAVHGNLGITYHPNEKASMIAECLENNFTFHDLCDENHEREVETTVQALFSSIDGTPLGKQDLVT